MDFWHFQECINWENIRSSYFVLSGTYQEFFTLLDVCPWLQDMFMVGVDAALMVILSICAAPGHLLYLLNSRVWAFAHWNILFYYKLSFSCFFFILKLREYIIFKNNNLVDSTIHEFCFRIFKRMLLNICRKSVLDWELLI